MTSLFVGQSVIVSRSVTDEARARLREASYRALQQVACECAGDVLYLQGRVPSFYFKQLAQEAVGRLPGVGRVVNQIEVAPPPSR